MKNLFDEATLAELRMRLAQLDESHEREWGTMDAAQVVAHCAAVMELALGERRPKRVLAGRILGWLVKRQVIGTDRPIRRNAPSIKEVLVLDRRNLDDERERLLELIDRFAAAGPARCTTHPHPFFGRLTPKEWAIFEYKHLDHHLRQFGA